MWPAKSIMQSMRPAMPCRFPTPDLAHFKLQILDEKDMLTKF